MSPEGSVRVHHVWKRFRADRGRKLGRDLMARATRRANAEDRWRWVLRDIDFEVEPGESVGIVGVNGSGKSTLLKIVAGVMFPHSGHVETNGRIGALIEVMSGISPELTGRENVLIYGTLLGLSRREITGRFDQIVEFAEVENAIDRQVKYYSSGMKMRLGFAIAAFLEPSILIVDEVLAVGDSSFQQKCLNRMREVTQSGTTLLLVSHDLAAVSATAQRGIWLENSLVRAAGPVDEVLTQYRTAIEERAEDAATTNSPVRVRNVRISGGVNNLVTTNESCTISFDVESDESVNVNLYVGITEGAPTPIFVVRRDEQLLPGTTPFTLELPRLPIPRGKYFVWSGCYTTVSRIEKMPWHPIAGLPVIGRQGLDPTPGAIVRLSPVWVESSWTIGKHRESFGAEPDWSEAAS
jgi:ABC-type polysaccharide/polyol phosphate transport system ATPase subunit